MQDDDPQPPRPILLASREDIFPGPFAAILLTLAAIFAMAFVAGLAAGQPGVAAIGIAEALGLGGVATLAARRVPEPQADRLGMHGFDRRLIVPLLCMLPIVILVSELDNWVRIAIPPSEELSELAKEMQEISKIDSLYAGIQTAIVALGITPVVEGFFFFGVLLQGVVAHLGRVRGVVLTAALFSFIHFPIAGTPGEAIVPVFSSLLTGALFGLTRLATGSILPAIGLAAGFGGITIAAITMPETLAIPGFNTGEPHTPLSILLPCAALVLYGFSILRRLAAEAPIHIPIPESLEGDDEEGFHF